MPVYEGQGSTAPAISKDGHGVNYQDLCDIIRARVEEILKLIMLELPNADYEATIPAGMVLTGGSANLAGLATLGCEILKMPVRIGTPNDVYGIADVLRDPAYSTAVGLLLWGTKHDGKKQWKSGPFSGLTQLATQLKKLFGSNNNNKQS